MLRSVSPTYFGKKNADFGQGFYLTSDMDFARRWARGEAIVNEYELDESGLVIHRFVRNEDWFHYIFRNRRFTDGLSADIVIGPIANDTIFDTLGVISSGFLKDEDAMKLLMIGPEYTQLAVKTERAVKQLRWLRSEKISKPDAKLLKAERDAYSEAFSKVMITILGEKYVLSIVTDIDADPRHVRARLK